MKKIFFTACIALSISLHTNEFDEMFLFDEELTIQEETHENNLTEQPIIDILNDDDFFTALVILRSNNDSFITQNKTSRLPYNEQIRILSKDAAKKLASYCIDIITGGHIMLEEIDQLGPFVLAMQSAFEKCDTKSPEWQSLEAIKTLSDHKPIEKAIADIFYTTMIKL